MKKLIFSLFFIRLAIGIFAQSEAGVLTTKKGVPIKPASGDYAIGIDATPFFRYAGNLFSGNNSYYPSFGFTAQAPGAIFGKYVASENTIYRASILVGISNETMKFENDVDEDKIDKFNTSALTVGITGGVETHRNMIGRLTGYYGAQAGISKEPYSSYVSEAGDYYYGKYVYKDGNDSDQDYKEVGGNTISLMVGGFVGVEFFIAPKISLAGEYG